MRRIIIPLLGLIATLAVVPSPAHAWGYGVNRVQTAAEDGHAQTGMGPGWVLLSYKANGPMVGYLFARDFRFANGVVKTSFDHMDIRATGNHHAGNTEGITRWPWGFAAGSFSGCAYAYGTSKFAITRTGFMSTRCANGPNVVGSHDPSGNPPDVLRWWHSEQVFCTTNNIDPLCSPWGVWSSNKGGGLKVTRVRTGMSCQAYGNIGARAAYGSGAAVPVHPLGAAPAGAQIDVRYVTKDRQWIMAKWHGVRFAAGIAWAFMPRSCVN